MRFGTRAQRHVPGDPSVLMDLLERELRILLQEATGTAEGATPEGPGVVIDLHALKGGVDVHSYVRAHLDTPRREADEVRVPIHWTNQEDSTELPSFDGVVILRDRTPRAPELIMEGWCSPSNTALEAGNVSGYHQMAHRMADDIVQGLASALRNRVGQGQPVGQ